MAPMKLESVDMQIIAAQQPQNTVTGELCMARIALVRKVLSPISLICSVSAGDHGHILRPKKSFYQVRKGHRATRARAPAGQLPTALSLHRRRPWRALGNHVTRARVFYTA